VPTGFAITQPAPSAYASTTSRATRRSPRREIGQELVVGEVELELQRVAVDGLQTLHRRVVVELARFLRFRDDGLGADEAPVQALQEFERILGSSTRFIRRRSRLPSAPGAVP
jgi:hypothetical protein